MASAELLEELFPRYDFRERHERSVAAPATAVYDALRSMTLAETPIARALMAIRSIPARVGGSRPWAHRLDRPFVSEVVGPARVVLADVPGRELVIGLAGPMWQPRGRLVRFADAAAFSAFDALGNVKAAISFAMRPAGGRTLLTTETRVLALDPASRRRFALYWLVIRPWSGLIRREWLSAIARRAERAAAANARAPGAVS